MEGDSESRVITRRLAGVGLVLLMGAPQSARRARVRIC